MAASQSTYLITTEKDAVKLHPYFPRLGTVYVAPLELQFFDVNSDGRAAGKTILNLEDSMTISKELLEILVCPKCKGKIEISADNLAINLRCLPSQLSHTRRDTGDVGGRGR